MAHIIFDSQFYPEAIPSGFNAVKIRIDGGIKSDLFWIEEKQAAREIAAKGLNIFWEMDLGISSLLKHPITHPSQFLSFKLSLEHFRDTLWKEFQDQSIGISLYRGTIDFAASYLFDVEQEKNLSGWLEDKFETIEALNEELSHNFSTFFEVASHALKDTPRGRQILQIYCRDTVSEYLDLLAGKLPEGLNAYLMIDANPIPDPLHVANLLSKVHFPHLILAVKGPLFHIKEFSWEDTLFQFGYFGRRLPQKGVELIPRIAICLPSLSFYKPSDYEVLRGVIEKLNARASCYKLIPEERLTQEWEGIDYLIVQKEKLTTQGIRMLQGFAAAGGTVILTEAQGGIQGEMDFVDFLEVPCGD